MYTFNLNLNKGDKLKHLKTTISSFIFLVAISSPLSVRADVPLPSDNNAPTLPDGMSIQQVLEAQSEKVNLIATQQELQASESINLQTAQQPKFFVAGSPNRDVNLWKTKDDQGHTVLLFLTVAGDFIKSVTLDSRVTGIGEGQFSSDGQSVFVFENTADGKQLAMFSKNGNAQGEMSSKLWKLGSGHILWTSKTMIGTSNGVFAYVPTVGLSKVLGLSANKNVFLSKTFDPATNMVVENLTEIATTNGQWGAPKTYAVNSYVYNPAKFDLTYLAGIFNGDQILYVTTDGNGNQRVRAADCSRPLYDSWTTLGPIRNVAIHVDSRGHVTMTFLRGGSIKKDYTFTIGGGK